MLFVYLLYKVRMPDFPLKEPQEKKKEPQHVIYHRPLRVVKEDEKRKDKKKKKKREITLDDGLEW